jgi:hypothetical protein
LELALGGRPVKPPSHACRRNCCEVILQRGPQGIAGRDVSEAVRPSGAVDGRWTGADEANFANPVGSEEVEVTGHRRGAERPSDDHDIVKVKRREYVVCVVREPSQALSPSGLLRLALPARVVHDHPEPIGKRIQLTVEEAGRTGETWDEDDRPPAPLLPIVQPNTVAGGHDRHCYPLETSG